MCVCVCGQVAENQRAGTSVGRVEAVDDDSSADFRRVIYDVVESSSTLLTLDRVTGLILTTASIDRERVTSLTLRVSATAAAHRCVGVFVASPHR